MASNPTPRLPQSKIPAWERRRSPERWKWNGNRSSDPKLPKLELSGHYNPVRVLLYALARGGLGVLLLFLALR